MTPKTKRLIGWGLTILVALFLIGASGIPKFLDWDGKKEMMDKMGIPLDLVPTLGMIEIVVAIIFLIPQTAFLGAILLTGYLGGAVFAHLRINDTLFTCLFPVILGVVTWIALGLRHPAIFHLAFRGMAMPSVK